MSCESRRPLYLREGGGGPTNVNINAMEVEVLNHNLNHCSKNGRLHNILVHFDVRRNRS